MKITLPEHVSYITRTLTEAGYEAYAVGGCVRDTILGRVPDDWDITTSAMPEETKALFRRTVDTGIQHGTVTVMMAKEGYEVTTYRIDGKYTDSRHPDSVSFTRCLTEDLKRRDFTINAMAYNDTDGLVDKFDGTGDLENHIIRCVGNPIERFGEDALRILRAVRFSAQLGFSIDNETLKAAETLAPTLSKISAERIRVELNKLLLSPNPDRLRLVYSLGLSNVIFPELNACFEGPDADRMTELLTAAPHNPYLRWAVLLYYTGAHSKILRRLKWDNLTMRTIDRLITFSNRPVTGLDDCSVRELICDFLPEDIFLLLDFRQALNPEIRLDETRSQVKTIIERGDCTSLKDLAVCGVDLIKAGCEPGPDIGNVLDFLLKQVLKNPSLNDRETLLELAKTCINKRG